MKLSGEYRYLSHLMKIAHSELAIISRTMIQTVSTKTIKTKLQWLALYSVFTAIYFTWVVHSFALFALENNRSSMLVYFLRWYIWNKKNKKWADICKKSTFSDFNQSKHLHLFAEREREKTQTNTINLLGKLKRLLRSYYGVQGVGG